MDTLPRFDGLRLVEHLATENVAEIYAGIQEPLGRAVIVKSLRQNVLPTSPFALALEREARLLGELSHPYVQRLYEFRREETRMWLVLERVDGYPLDQLLKRFKQLPLPAVVSLGVMISSALTHCHELGITHRDIQPKHIVIAPGGRVVITHFVGALKDRLPTAPELLDGIDRPSIVPYMSPEQILGESADGRTDLFSLSCVLYEAITGQNPFEGPDDRSVAQRIRHVTPPLPSRQVPGIPSGFDRVIQRCLEKLPSDRFFDASEVNAALEKLLRQIGSDNPERCLNTELSRLGLFRGSMRTAPLQESKLPARSKVSPARTILGLAVCSGLIMAGGLFAQQGATKSGFNTRQSGKLMLRPERAGFLRLVVDPWASVSIDGQFIDTTPFSHSISLPAGTHYVHLEHPQAEPERRTVTISDGETILLDVKMKVPISSSDAGVLPLPAPSSSDNSP